MESQGNPTGEFKNNMFSYSFPTYVAKWSARGPPWESVTKNLRYFRFPPNLNSVMISSLANYRPFFSSFPHTPPSGEFCQVS